MVRVVVELTVFRCIGASTRSTFDGNEEVVSLLFVAYCVENQYVYFVALEMKGCLLVEMLDLSTLSTYTF
jgi:hypothetical protein